MGFDLKRFGLRQFVVRFLLALGCASVSCSAGHQVENVYRASVRLPPHVRRVAVLPVNIAEADPAAESGRDDLEPVLHGELRKVNDFDVVLVSREQLRALTGRLEWAAQEELPHDFLPGLRQATGCDAVLFVKLTSYRPYAPVALGWEMELVDVASSQVLWSVDQTFDAGEPGTACAALHYCAERIHAVARPDLWTVRSSPHRFGQFTLHAVFSTLPAR